MIDVHMHPCRMRDHEAYRHFEKTGQIPDRVIDSFMEAVKDVEKAVVLAFIAPQSDIVVSNEFVAAVVRNDPARLMGFACADPRDQDAIAHLEYAVDRQGFRGIKLAPLYQHFNPVDPRYWPLYSWIENRGLPLMWHQGTSFMASEGPLEDARPVLLDKIARAFPEMRMIIAHFGFPWASDVLALLGKHRYLYTDISVLADRTWYLYNAIRGAIEYGVEGKIFLGSDYPAFTAAQTVQALRALPRLTTQTSLPPIPEQVVEAIIERDSLSLLGVEDWES